MIYIYMYIYIYKYMYIYFGKKENLMYHFFRKNQKLYQLSRFQFLVGFNFADDILRALLEKVSTWLLINKILQIKKPLKSCRAI